MQKLHKIALSLVFICFPLSAVAADCNDSGMSGATYERNRDRIDIKQKRLYWTIPFTGDPTTINARTTINNLIANGIESTQPLQTCDSDMLRPKNYGDTMPALICINKFGKKWEGYSTNNGPGKIFDGNGQEVSVSYRTPNNRGPNNIYLGFCKSNVEVIYGLYSLSTPEGASLGKLVLTKLIDYHSTPFSVYAPSNPNSYRF